MGGRDSFNQMMDSVFNLPPVYDDSYYHGIIHEIREMQVMNMGNYAHGNQPIQHTIYLYGYSGQPWKSQYWIREVMNRLYNPNPDAYCGDEDNGQTSAWYVFSALGFYPVCPGSNQYVIGTPYFKNVTLHYENGRTLTISAPNNSDANRYIESLDINGTASTRNYFTHSELNEGGKIMFRMSGEPNKLRGVLKTDAPYSFSSEKVK
jgi:predicted alpha-1,2-mannosidase